MKALVIFAIALEVHYGEKTNSFQVPDLKKSEIVVNGALKKVSDADFKAIVEKARTASEQKSNERRLCGRKYMELVVVENKKSTTVVGCIGSKTPAATKLTDLSNAMLLL